MSISCSKMKMNARTLQICCQGEMARGRGGSSCKRSRTARSSMKMGWYHMVSEASTERFVFRARTGPLCPAESSKMQLCEHHKKAEKADSDGVYSGV